MKKSYKTELAEGIIRVADILKTMYLRLNQETGTSWGVSEDKDYSIVCDEIVSDMRDFIEEECDGVSITTQRSAPTMTFEVGKKYRGLRFEQTNEEEPIVSSETFEILKRDGTTVCARMGRTVFFGELRIEESPIIGHSEVIETMYAEWERSVGQVVKIVVGAHDKLRY